MAYAELQTATAFSFLRGASLAEELVATASALGLSALGIADRNSVAGVVRAHVAAKAAGLRLLVGARLVFADGTPDVICYPTDRAAWGRLTRLLSIGKLRAPKGECVLNFSDLADARRRASGHRGAAAHAGPVLRRRAGPPRRHFPRQPPPRRQPPLCRQRRGAAARTGGAGGGMRRAELVATNDVLYHAPERRPLQDVMTCIRLKTTIATAGLALHPNAERHLKSPAEMARLFHAHPQAVARTQHIVGALPLLAGRADLRIPR